MKKIKIAIIGPKTKNTVDLVNEIRKRNFEVITLKLDETVFEFTNNKFRILKENIDLSAFDIYILRAFDRNTTEAQILAGELVRKNKVVIDETVGKDFVSGKIFEASKLTEAKVNIPKTWQALCFSSYKKLLNKITFPIIAKPVCGQKGRGLEKINNEKKYLEFFSKNKKGYFIQEYLPITSDFRVMVVGSKVIGAVERFVMKGDFRSNTSLGSKVVKAKLNKEMREIAISASRALKFEVAGVDLTKYKNKYYILEVNHTPQWQNVKKLNKMNPAKCIIDYALEKHKKS